MTTFKHRKVQKKRKYGLYALLVGLIAAAILALSVFLLFHIQKIEVTGIEMLTQQEVSDWVKSDTTVSYTHLVPATPDQVMEYDSPTSSYVKQYEEIPENGILAQSSKVSK